MSNVTSIDTVRPRVLEFFAGIGLARMGLESAGFRVVWANDYEADKKAMYEAQFGSEGDAFALGDVAKINAADLPPGTSLAWASSPCTDLSLAGGRAGLDGRQSGTFWEFVRILEQMGESRPEVVVLENVTGLATSHGGDDLVAAIRAFNVLGYSVDVLAIDARRFLPQSRPRLFIVGATNPPLEEEVSATDLRPDWLGWVHRDPTLRTHRAIVPALPAPLFTGLSATVERLPSDDDRWWDQNRTAAFLNSLSTVQEERVALLKDAADVTFRTAYRRTRGGAAVWEVRPDDIAGCLRTARGGSSKQAVVELGRGNVKVRWMTPREYGRLMGAPDYDLSNTRTSQAMFGFGDAVAVPVVSWLATNYLMPLIRSSARGLSVDHAASAAQ